MNTADRQLLQQALDALDQLYLPGELDRVNAVILALNDRLAHCDRCGKKLGGEGDIHTCTPKADPIGDAQDRLIAELAAQPAPVQKPVATMRMLHTYGDTTPPAAAPMTKFEEAVAAVDNTLHYAINHWQDRALKAEAKLAQPKQEPVAWISAVTGDVTTQDMSHTVSWVPLTTPPAAQPAPVQEPVHQWREKHSAYWYDGYPDNDDGGGPYETRTLYATPPAAQRPWVDLTDEEISHMWRNSPPASHDFARAIEAKLKEKNT